MFIVALLEEQFPCHIMSIQVLAQLWDSLKLRTGLTRTGLQVDRLMELMELLGTKKVLFSEICPLDMAIFTRSCHVSSYQGAKFVNTLDSQSQLTRPEGTGNTPRCSRLQSCEPSTPGASRCRCRSRRDQGYHCHFAGAAGVISPLEQKRDGYDG